MSDPGAIARIRREIYDASQHFQPGADPDTATPIFQNLIDTYGEDAVMEAVNQIQALDGQPIHRP